MTLPGSVSWDHVRVPSISLLGMRPINTVLLHCQNLGVGHPTGSAFCFRLLALLVLTGVTVQPTANVLWTRLISLALTSTRRWATQGRVLLSSGGFACCVPSLFVGLGLPQPLSPWSWLVKQSYCLGILRTWLDNCDDNRCLSFQKGDLCCRRLRRIETSFLVLLTPGAPPRTFLLRRCWMLH